MTIAVLALQGAFLEHERALKKLGVDFFEIRQAADLTTPFDGLILLAGEVIGGGVHFGTMDISVRRNAYGRQLNSFYTEGPFEGIGTVPMTFIRAPYITSVSRDTRILTLADGHIVAAMQKNQIVTAFHPELNDDLRIHQYFLDSIRARTTVSNSYLS